MMEVITTAGAARKPPDKRRERVAAIRATLFRTDASDDERDDAIDALLELSKE